jgi:hypothetical protein
MRHDKIKKTGDRNITNTNEAVMSKDLLNIRGARRDKLFRTLSINISSPNK